LFYFCKPFEQLIFPVFSQFVLFVELIKNKKGRGEGHGEGYGEGGGGDGEEYESAKEAGGEGAGKEASSSDDGEEDWEHAEAAAAETARRGGRKGERSNGIASPSHIKPFPLHLPLPITRTPNLSRLSKSMIKTSTILLFY